MVFERPELLVDNRFFAQIQKVNQFLQKTLINFIVKRISSVSDITKTVEELHNALQRNMKILDTMDELGKEDERLNSYELSRLLVYLKTLEHP